MNISPTIKDKFCISVQSCNTLSILADVKICLIYLHRRRHHHHHHHHHHHQSLLHPVGHGAAKALRLNFRYRTAHCSFTVFHMFILIFFNELFNVILIYCCFFTYHCCGLLRLKILSLILLEGKGFCPDHQI